VINVTTVEPAMSLKDVAALLVERRISGLPVVDPDGKVLGVISEADILFKECGARPAGSRSDEAIAREIREDVVLKTLWIAPEALDISVDKGKVRLGGSVESKTDAELIEAFARRVPGTVSVESHLSWLEENGRRR